MIKNVKFIATILLTLFVLNSCSVNRPSDSIDSFESASENDSLELSLNGDSSINEHSNEPAAESREGSETEVFCGGIFGDKKSLKFVALGDSIAQGYGLKNPVECSYPAIIFNTIKQKLPKTDVSFTNYAVAGNTTADLLYLLQNGKIDLDNANIITICIGANNVLSPLIDSISPLFTLLNQLRSDYSGVDINQVFDSVNSVLNSRQFSEALNAGIENAKNDLDMIYSIINQKCPNAIVMVMTVYSPYHDVNITFPYIEKSILLSDMSDEWVSKLNAVIIDKANAYGCKLVDCYKPFLTQKNLLNVSVGNVISSISLDPHPNLPGHIYIANLHIAELMQPKA